MTIEELQLRGFRPINSQLHKITERGIVGSFLLEKRHKHMIKGKNRKQVYPRLYMSFVYLIKGQLRLGEPIPMPMEEKC